MSPDRYHDPANLLPACSGCNGRDGKSDYHPKNKHRTKWKEKKFHVIDVRAHDLAKIFEIYPNGEISPRPGRFYDMAIENILLFKLDRESHVETRKEIFEILHATLESMEVSGRQRPFSNPVAKGHLNSLISFIITRSIFFHVFDIRLNRKILRERDRRPRNQRASSIPLGAAPVAVVKKGSSKIRKNKAAIRPGKRKSRLNPKGL